MFSRSLHRSRWMPATLVALTMLGASVGKSMAWSYWFEDYQKAVYLIDHGHHAEAFELLRNVIHLHPVPVRNLRISGDRAINYVPYYERARIQVLQGDFPAAFHSLDLNEAFGSADFDVQSRKDHDQLRIQIERADPSLIARSHPEPVPISLAPR